MSVTIIAPVEISQKFGQLVVRGNDPYRLYGEALNAKKYFFPLKNYTLSGDEERQFLVHEAFNEPLSSINSPDPFSTDQAYNLAIKKRLEAPIWERAYKITGDVSVSGNRGYVFVNGKLFKPSTYEKPPPHHNLYKFAVEKFRKASSKRIECDEVLLVRHTLGHIYFHTYHDLLSKIAWADELGIDPEIPIVVSNKWATGHYGKHFMQSDLFKRRKVIFQGLTDPLVCNTLHWLRTPQFCKRHLDRVAHSFAEQQPKETYSTRLALLREQKTHDNRYCDGFDKLADKLAAKGYSVFDPAGLSIPEQKWVFSRATHIVGLNGSAFTNIVHKKDQDLQIDSIIPSRSTTSTFQAMAKAYGFKINSHIVHSEKMQDGVRAFLSDDQINAILETAF